MSERPWHTRSIDDTVRAMETDQGAGLSRAEAARRLATNGPNELAAAKKRSLLALIAHQFRSLIVGLLVLASSVAFILGDHIEAIAILVVILLNALIGFLTEWKAANALDSLRKQAVSIARVRRDGAQLEIPAADLVVGDLVLLAAGDRVPADARLIEQATLQVAEAALTGESVAVSKATDPVSDPNAPIGDRLSMVYLGTAVTDGRGTAVVTATGPATEMGRIGALIDDVADKATPLEGKLAQLSRALLVIVLVLCAVIVVTGWLRGIELLYMVEIGISLAIAAIPEGLLAVTTMTLAVGMQRMARMGALVRRLPAVESLGSTQSHRLGVSGGRDWRAVRHVRLQRGRYGGCDGGRVVCRPLQPLARADTRARRRRQFRYGGLSDRSPGARGKQRGRQDHPRTRSDPRRRRCPGDWVGP